LGRPFLTLPETDKGASSRSLRKATSVKKGNEKQKIGEHCIVVRGKCKKKNTKPTKKKVILTGGRESQALYTSSNGSHIP